MDLVASFFAGLQFVFYRHSSLNLPIGVIGGLLEQPHDKTNKVTVRPAKTLIRMGGCCALNG